MKNKIYAFCCMYLIIFCSVTSLYSVSGELSVVNGSARPFVIKYSYKGEPKSISRLAPQASAKLGKIKHISELHIKPYGKWIGWGAQMLYDPGYDEEKLNICKERMDEDCTLRIESAVKGWIITVSRGELARARLPMDPTAYFSAKDDPRKVLDLGPEYTRQDVGAARIRKIDELKGYPDLPEKQKIIDFLNMASAYANALLEVPKEESARLIIEWRGMLQPLRVERGKVVACNILSDRRMNLRDQNEYLNAITDLMWYFYSLAIKKRQAFEEGTFLLEDPNLKFYNFLIGYVKLVNSTIKGTLKDPALTRSGNYYGYSRLSSHFKLEQESYRHYGIDIRFLNETQAQSLLPTGKCHILFGKVTDDKIFIKMESAGLTLRDIPWHAAEFVGAQVRKVIPSLKQFVDQYISPQYFSDFLIYYIGVDDNPNYRKERVPQEFIQTCFTILQHGNLSSEVIKKHFEKFITRGLQYLDQLIKNPPNEFSSEQINEFRLYHQKLSKDYDNLSIRYGREVIFIHHYLVEQC